jgi:photosystem II stability/assembly factor-like uncharacterized protein
MWNSSVGWFVYPPFIYRTVNGGTTWTRAAMPVPQGVALSSVNVKALKFFSDRDGVVVLWGMQQNVGYTYLSTTLDGGVHWSTPNDVPVGSSHDLIFMYFFDSRNWVGSPYSGGFVRTSDGGEQWDSLTPQKSGLSAGGVLDFVDQLHGWEYSRYDLFATTDGGIHWTRVAVARSG